MLEGLALGVLVRALLPDDRPSMREAWVASAIGLFVFALLTTLLFLTSRGGEDFVRLLWMSQLALGHADSIRALSDVPSFGYLTTQEALAAASDPLGAFWRFFRLTLPGGALGAAAIFMQLGLHRGFPMFLRIAAVTLPFAALGWAMLIWIVIGLLRLV